MLPLDMGYKRGVKNDFKSFAWTTKKIELLFAALEKIIGRLDFEQEENKKIKFLRYQAGSWLWVWNSEGKSG